MAKQEVEKHVSAVPEHLKKYVGDTRGTDHITKDDITIPRFGLAQGLSPQIIPGDAKYIKGLAMGDMFNNLTSQIYGAGPIDIVIVRADKPRGIEFFPLKDGGGIKDFNVPITDSRMMFGPNGEKPVATKFYDFITLMLPIDPESPMTNIVALSMKATSIKTAKKLNTMLKQLPVPSFTRRFKLTSKMTKNAKGQFAVFDVENYGFLAGPELEAAEKVFESIKDTSFKIEREPGQDDEEAPTNEM